MAATVHVYVHTGSGPSNTNTDSLGPPNIRLKTADDATIDDANPIPIPTGATPNRSFWKTITLWAETSPTGTINNIKFYTDGGGFGTGITTYVGDETSTTYDQATGTVGTTGDEMVASHSEITAKTDAFSYTSTVPKDVSGSITTPSTGRISDYIVLQLDVASSSSPGNLSNETLVLRYDET
jgi:hypothetical protein